MTFRHFIQTLAEKIGMHQIPVIANASEIRYFLAEDGVHHQFVTSLVRDIYKINRCGHLDAILDQEKTMSLLGRSRVEIVNGDDADICRVRLMNEFCEVASEVLGNDRVSAVRTTPSTDDLPERVKI